MAIDFKYGRVTLEHGTIGEDEPVVVFRARDVHLGKVLGYYMMLCMKNMSPPRHLAMILASHKNIREWQGANLDKVKNPDSETSREWMN